MHNVALVYTLYVSFLCIASTSIPILIEQGLMNGHIRMASCVLRMHIPISQAPLMEKVNAIKINVSIEKKML